MSAIVGANKVYLSEIPRTRPSVESEVEAGCIETPFISFEFAFSQSGTTEPRTVFVAGRNLSTV
jgi:hypothetical protein